MKTLMTCQDGKAPVNQLEEEANALRSLCAKLHQKNQALIDLLYMAVPYVEEGEQFNKPSAPKLSNEIKAMLASLPKA